MQSPDIVIVGGGIAGGALAAVLAAASLDVLVLERQTGYRDHVRGEIVWPWGVRAARSLGLERVLLDAGALVVPVLDVYDEGSSRPLRLQVDEAVDGIEGSLNIRHPHACAALAEAASRAGAAVRMGVREVRVDGERRRVRWIDGGGSEHEARCGLVVGADGRRSSVRSQQGIALEVDPPAHLVAGMLVEAVEGMDETVNVMGREGDVIFYAFPQQRGQARLYFSFPNGQAARFGGPDGASRFLDTCELGCLQGLAGWSRGDPAGPCATFPGEDSRTPSPIAGGVALIGDAAGYENPLQGQGLAMAFQDVGDLARLVASQGASADLTEYAELRARRKRLVDLGTILEVWTNDACAAQDPGERAARFAFVEADDVLSALSLSFMTGVETLPQDLTAAELAEMLAAHA